jgi:hypothetical protein
MAAVPLRPSKAPNLLVAPIEYRQQYHDQMNNALRLYFNQVDNFTQNVTVPATGTTANRPTESLQVGQYYFDTTLGIPIWWNGAQWVNALGYPSIYVTGVAAVARVGTAVVTTYYPVVGVGTIGEIGTVTVTTI